MTSDKVDGNVNVFLVHKFTDSMWQFQINPAAMFVYLNCIRLALSALGAIPEMCVVHWLL